MAKIPIPKSKTLAADAIRRFLPGREELERNRLLRPVAHLLLRPALWRFTRRSVPRAVALGLVVGIFIMVPFVQPLSAALLAIPFRANVPLTAGTTLLSNPVTTPLIAVAALWVGSRLFGLHADPGSVMRMLRDDTPLSEWWLWLWSDAAPALFAGLSVISIAAGLIGWGLATLGWRWWIARKWRARGHHLRRLRREPDAA